MILLKTLGALELRGRDGQELGPLLAQPKRLALFAYLAVTSAAGFQRRDSLLALFWPELDNEHARAALNRAIYYVRQSVGKHVLLSRGAEEIGLSGQHFWCDAAAFQTAIAQARWPEALELYRGDLLDGFFISESPAFERWLDTERERLRELAVRAAWTFADEQAAAGQSAVAAYWARWAVERAPYHEIGVQRLIRMLDAMGDRAGAVHAYEQFSRRIADDLELTPAPETRALIELVRLRVRPAAGDGPPAHHLPSTETRHQPPPDIVLAQGPQPEPLVAGPLARARRSWPGTRLALVSAAALLVMVTTLLMAPGQTTTLDASQVVVVPFENRTGDPSLDRLSGMSARWIRLSLTETELVETVALPDAAAEASSCEQVHELRRLARAAHAAIIACGAYYLESGRLQFHAGVLDVLRGAPVWVVPPIAADVGTPEPALQEVRERVTGAVAALRNPSVATWFQHTGTPPTISAFQEYARSLESPEPKVAAAHMQRAAELDSMFTWGTLNAAQILLAYDPERADSLMDSLEVRLHHLPVLLVHGLAGLRAVQADNRNAAYEAFARAADLAPRIFLPAYAQAARSLYRPREGLLLLDRFDALKATGQQKSNGIIRSELLHQLGDHPRELAVVRQARRDYPRGLQSLYLEVRTRAALGQLPQVRSLIDSALTYPREKHYTPGNLMMIAAAEFRAHDRPAAEQEWLRRALEWYRANPTAEPDSCLGSLAAVLYQAGHWSDAELLYRKLLVQQPEYAVFYLGALGAVAARRGDRAAALRMVDSLKAFRFPNDLRAYDGKFERARIMALLGETEQALQLLVEANGPQGLDLHAEFDFESLKSDPEFKRFTHPKG